MARRILVVEDDRDIAHLAEVLEVQLDEVCDVAVVFNDEDAAGHGRSRYGRSLTKVSRPKPFVPARIQAHKKGDSLETFSSLSRTSCRLLGRPRRQRRRGLYGD